MIMIAFMQLGMLQNCLHRLRLWGFEGPLIWLRSDYAPETGARRQATDAIPSRRAESLR